MKKRLFLVNYKFTTAGHEYNEYKLVSIKFEGTMDDEWGLRLAEAQVRARFEGSESQLTEVTASTAIEAVYSKPKTSDKQVSAPGIEVPVGWFTNETKPFVDPDLNDPEDGLVSDQVLLDIDGRREVFCVGKWHFDHGEDAGWWSTDEFFESSIDPENMRWSYLPLARYSG